MQEIVNETLKENGMKGTPSEDKEIIRVTPTEANIIQNIGAQTREMEERTQKIKNQLGELHK